MNELGIHFKRMLAQQLSHNNNNIGEVDDLNSGASGEVKPETALSMAEETQKGAKEISRLLAQNSRLNKTLQN